MARSVAEWLPEWLPEWSPEVLPFFLPFAPVRPHSGSGELSWCVNIPGFGSGAAALYSRDAVAVFARGVAGMGIAVFAALGGSWGVGYGDTQVMVAGYG